MNDTEERQASTDADNVTSQLIDSYFLPGGILDPEDTAATISDDNDRGDGGGAHNRYDFSDHESAEYSRRNRRDPFQPSSLDYGRILPQRSVPLSADNSTTTLSTGVGALDPIKDEVIITGSGSRFRQGPLQLHAHAVPSPVTANASQTNFFDNNMDFIRLRKSSLSVEATNVVISPNYVSSQNIQGLSRNAPETTLRNIPGDYEWHRQNFSNPSRAPVRDVYPSQPATHSTHPRSSSASDDFTSLFDAVPIGQQIPSSSHTRASASDESVKVNSNPWSHDDLVTLPMAAKSQQGRYDFHLKFGDPTNEPRSNSESTSFNRKSHDHQPSSIPTPPPGFTASSKFNQENLSDRNRVIGARAHLQSTTTAQIPAPSKPIQHQPMNYSRVVNQNISSTYNPMNSQDRAQHQEGHGGRVMPNHSSHVEQRQSTQDHRSPYKHSPPISSPTRKKSYAALQSTLNHDVDYEFQPNSRSDVPSTIYVEEDAKSNSEDTLTVCADSVTVASVPQSRAERFDMDVVEETSLSEVSSSVVCKVYSRENYALPIFLR